MLVLSPAAAAVVVAVAVGPNGPVEEALGSNLSRTGGTGGLWIVDSATHEAEAELSDSAPAFRRGPPSNKVCYRTSSYWSNYSATDFPPSSQLS